MPVTVRQMYYQLIDKGYPKTKAFYGRVQRELSYMRQEGVLPYDFIVKPKLVEEIISDYLK